MNAIYQTGPNGLAVFMLVTVVMGGAAAWVTGRAIAETWRPRWHLVAYAAMLACAVRFIHYALFAQPFLPPANVAIGFAVLLAIALLANRVRRRSQMAEQYPWLTAEGTARTDGTA